MKKTLLGLYVLGAVSVVNADETVVSTEVVVTEENTTTTTSSDVATNDTKEEVKEESNCGCQH